MLKRDMYSGLPGVSQEFAEFVCDYAYSLFEVVNALKAGGKATVGDLKNKIEQGFDELIFEYLGWLRKGAEYRSLIARIDRLGAEVGSGVCSGGSKEQMSLVRQWYRDLDGEIEAIKIPRLLDFLRYDSMYMDRIGASILSSISADLDQDLDLGYFERLQQSLLSAIIGKEQAMAISGEILQSVIQIGNVRQESGSFASV